MNTRVIMLIRILSIITINCRATIIDPSYSEIVTELNKIMQSQEEESFKKNLLNELIWSIIVHKLDEETNTPSVKKITLNLNKVLAFSLNESDKRNFLPFIQKALFNSERLSRLFLNNENDIHANHLLKKIFAFLKNTSEALRHVDETNKSTHDNILHFLEEVLIDDISSCEQCRAILNKESFLEFIKKYALTSPKLCKMIDLSQHEMSQEKELTNESDDESSGISNSMFEKYITDLLSMGNDNKCKLHKFDTSYFL